MVLEFVINGYYRTGTTIIARIIKLSNPHLLYFHEPTSPIIINDIERFGVRPHSLHGFPVYIDYLRLGSEFLKFFRRVHRPYDFVLEPSEGVRILHLFHALREPCFVKCNQLHLVLDIVAEMFNIPVIHVIRDPVETLFDHVYPEYQSNETILKKIFIERDVTYFKYLGFWLFDIYRSVKRRFGIEAECEHDPIEVFAINYTVLNIVAQKLCEISQKCYILTFEDFLDDPYVLIDYLYGYVDVRLDEQYLKLLDRDKAIKAPDWLRQEAVPILRSVRERVRKILNI